MIVQPKIRGFICTTAHPVGCAKNVDLQIKYVKSQKPVAQGPKKVLVVGASNGYGLASRVVASFGGTKAATLGVFFEKEAESGKRPATAGWYNSVAFEQRAQKEGIYAKSINGDAFSDEIKKQVIDTIKKDFGQIDLFIYSLASPRRQDPKTGEVYKSVLRPIGSSYTNRSLDLSTNKLETVSLPPATEEEIRHTIGVMGGDDWKLWVEALDKEGVLAKGCETVAYSYIGPEVTKAIYRSGTIGKAKEHLENTAHELDKKFKVFGGRALVSVNKALVTQSSSAIPFIPLYFTILTKVMKQKGIEEGCIEQIYRLFATRLYNGAAIPTDNQGLIRLDDWEMRADVQEEVKKRWEAINENNIGELADVDGYQKDFMKLFGFGLEGVDYNQDVEIDLKLS